MLNNRFLLLIIAALLAAAPAAFADDGDGQGGESGIPPRPVFHGSALNYGTNATVEVLVLG